MKHIEKIKNHMELRTLESIAPLYEYAAHIDAVYGFLCDIQSKYAYEKELTFQVLKNTLNLNDAIDNLSPMGSSVFLPFLEQAKSLHAQGRLPHILMPEDLSEFFVNFIYATTFLIEQYKYDPHVQVNVGDVVLDCGGYLGETSIWAAMQGAKTCYCFEPSLQNQEYVLKNIEKHKMQNKIIHAPFALGVGKDVVNFEQVQDNGGASCLSSKSATSFEVNMTSLDLFCAEHNVKPDFIKMDIEGAELNALMGAKNIIKTHKPSLAISLYHNLSDMWMIPLLIKDICPEYSFWCKKNAYISEFVLYAKVV